MYEVQEIVSSRLNKKGKKQYYVKWVGYDSSQNTWEPEKNLQSAQEALRQFFKKEGLLSNNSGGMKRYTTQAKPRQDVFQQQKDEPSDRGLDDQQNDISNGLESQISNYGISKKNPKQKRKKGRPSQQFLSTIKKSERIQVKILGMNEIQNQTLIFKIEINGKIQWVKKGFFIPDYMFELIQFYQSKILFKDEVQK